MTARKLEYRKNVSRICEDKSEGRMHIFIRGDRNSHGAARNSVTGAELNFVNREGERDEAYSVWRYSSATEDFEVCLKGEVGKRQALALLPNPPLWGDLTNEGRRDLIKRRELLRQSLNIVYYEVIMVRRKMPLEMPLAEDLLQLFWIRNRGLWQESDTRNFTAGFLNVDPDAPIGKIRPYLKIDQHGISSVNNKGN